MSVMNMLASASTYQKVIATYIGNTTITTDLTTYTFSTHAIGTANGERIVVVGPGARANAARTISSVTIQGITATAIATANATGGGADICALYAAYVPTGTTGDIVVTYSGAMLRCNVGVWTVVGAKALAAFDAQTDITLTAGANSVSMNCPANGAIIGVGWMGGVGAVSATWAGITEDYDVAPEGASNGASGANASFNATQTALTVSATWVNSSSGGIAVASWGP